MCLASNAKPDVALCGTQGDTVFTFLMISTSELEDAGLIVIVRAAESEGVLEAARALQRGGVRAMEVTLNTPNSLELIAAIRAESEREAEPMCVGAGTILDAADARRAIEAGAEFIVTPTLQLDSIAACREADVPILCGAMTPTECLAAHRAGADFVKLFPSASLGPDYARALLGPLPFLKLVPTGGVSEANLGAWLRAGCCMIAVGSELVSRRVLQERDFDALTQSARRFVQARDEARHQSGAGA